MRIIKFRVWSKEQLFMHECTAIEWQNGKIVTPDKGWVLMQYTGVKAKGKEIYEGDIVKTFIGNCKTDITETGIWFGGLDYITADKGGEIEVIGNIYENPELLKGGK